MRTRTSLIATLLTLAVVAVAVPLATASPANDNRLVIGIKLTFDSSTHASGSFAACCAVNDAGSAAANTPPKTQTRTATRFTSAYCKASDRQRVSRGLTDGRLVGSWRSTSASCFSVRT